MASTLSGWYCLGSVAAVAIAAVLGSLVAGSYASKVCLNKTPSPPFPADLFPAPFASPRPPRPRDPPASPPSSLPSSSRIRFLRMASKLADPVHPSTTSSGVHLESSSPLRLRHRAPPNIAGDDFATNLSVAWCRLQLQLSRGFFNRRLARFFHQGVCASGAPTTHRRRGHLRHRRCCCVYLVYGPFCNSALLQGPLCKLDA
jgi:hypothetical protein